MTIPQFKSMSKKGVVILSGGMDSTTMLYDFFRIGYVIKGVLSFNYGQRHVKELEYAKKTTAKLNLEHHVVDISNIVGLLGGSALTDNIDVPHGHYEAENMKLTVVPNRNMIMLSIATGYAVSKEADFVAFAAHGGDHAIYPDCRREFVDKLTEATLIANYQPVKILAPYLDIDKGDIAIRGKEIGVPYEDTWTCYEGKERPCLKCGACQERTLAFIKAEISDPLLTTEENIKAKDIVTLNSQ